MSETTAPTRPPARADRDPAADQLRALLELSSARQRRVRAERELTGALRRCVELGASDADIARVLNVSRQSVRARRLALETS